MGERFEIPVTYMGREQLFFAEMVATGYSYKIYVDVDGQQISFEPDEERNFRAVIADPDYASVNKIDRHLLEEIANTLISIFKD